MEDLFFFKLKKEYFAGFEVFEIAKNILGQPISWNFSEGFNGSLSQDLEFQFYNSRLTIDKPYFGELSFNLKQEHPYGDSWQIKFKQFVDEVKKPWSDWTEEEIICDPRWVFLFYQSNGMVSDAMHNSMVLGDPGNSHIKKYILLWQKLNQSQPLSLPQ